MEDRDTWQTSQELWNKLNKHYNFDFDCCASQENSKCIKYSDDFLKTKYSTYGLTCWMNPPFSKAYKMFEHFFKVVKKGVCIYRCDNMETKVWQNIILKNATWIFIPKGRIKYNGFKGTSSRFPSALIGFNVPEPKLKDGIILITSFNNSYKK